MRPPLFIQSVFGILGGIGPHPDDVAHMKRTADRLFGDQFRWSVLGAGRNQLPIASMSAAMGGNVRVGLEDSLWLGPGKLAESNAAQVSAARSIVEAMGLEIASPDEARGILNSRAAARSPSDWAILWKHRVGRALPCTEAQIDEHALDIGNTPGNCLERGFR